MTASPLSRPRQSVAPAAFSSRKFDWDEFDAGGGSRKKGPAVSEEHLRELFENGAVWLSQKDATAQLESIAEVRRSTAYAALKVISGRFSTLLRRREDGAIALKDPAD